MVTIIIRCRPEASQKIMRSERRQGKGEREQDQVAAAKMMLIQQKKDSQNYSQNIHTVGDDYCVVFTDNELAIVERQYLQFKS